MKYLLAITGSIIVGLTGYTVYTNSSLLNAFTVIFFGALFAHALRTKSVIWGTVKMLQQPYIVALIAIILGFTYISLKGFSFRPSTYFSMGTGMIGFAIGIMIYGLWNLR